MAEPTMRQTTLRIDAEKLRKARYYLDSENKSVNEFLVEQLETYIAQKEQKRQRREAVSA